MMSRALSLRILSKMGQFHGSTSISVCVFKVHGHDLGCHASELDCVARGIGLRRVCVMRCLGLDVCHMRCAVLYMRCPQLTEAIVLSYGQSRDDRHTKALLRHCVVAIR
eukprot:1205550-Rhodomonas_salina.3